MCNVYKHISVYRFRNRNFRLCIYLHRYRFGHTINQFREHVYKYNIQEDIENTNHCVSTDLSVLTVNHHSVSHIQSHSRDYPF